MFVERLVSRDAIQGSKVVCGKAMEISFALHSMVSPNFRVKTKSWVPMGSWMDSDFPFLIHSKSGCERRMRILLLDRRIFMKVLFCTLSKEQSGWFGDCDCQFSD